MTGLVETLAIALQQNLDLRHILCNEFSRNGNFMAECKPLCGKRSNDKGHKKFESGFLKAIALLLNKKRTKIAAQNFTL